MPGPRDKRQPRGFEPPPWEREQFEQLRNRQPPAEPEPLVQPELSPQQEGPAPIPSPEADAETIDTSGMSEAELDAMILGLGAEEGPPGGNLFGCGLTASIVTGFIGVVMLVFAIVAYARTAGAGMLAVIGPMAMGITGLALSGLAVWLAVRTFRRGA